MGALTLSHSVLLSSECISECGTLNSAELNLCCNIHSVQLSRGEGLHSAHLSISNFPLELLLIHISRLIFSARQQQNSKEFKLGILFFLFLIMEHGRIIPSACPTNFADIEYGNSPSLVDSKLVFWST